MVLLATLAAWLGFAVPSAGATDLRMSHAVVHACSGHHHSTVPSYTKTERGSPANFDQVTTADAVDRWSNGASARTPTDTTPVVFADDRPAPLVQVASVAPTQAQGDDAKAESVRSDRSGVAAKSESPLSRLLGTRARDERGSIGPFGKGTTEAGNRGARYSGKWYDSEDAARGAAERYAAKHPNSCTIRGLCGAGDHYHVDKEINGFLVHTRHYYFPG